MARSGLALLFLLIASALHARELSVFQPEPRATTRQTQSRPSIASNGSVGLVVWADSHHPCGIYGIRLDSSGVPLDPFRSAISNACGTDPVVTWTGQTFLVTWSESNLARARHLRSDGTPVESVPLDLAPMTAIQSVASNSQLAIAAAPLGPDTVGAFTSDGQASRIRVPGLTSVPVVARDGDGFILVSLAYENSTTFVVSQRLDRSGVVSGVPTKTAIDAPFLHTGLKLVSRPGGWVVYWRRYDSVRGLVLGADAGFTVFNGEVSRDVVAVSLPDGRDLVMIRSGGVTRLRVVNGTTVTDAGFIANHTTAAVVGDRLVAVTAEGGLRAFAHHIASLTALPHSHELSLVGQHQGQSSDAGNQPVAIWTDDTFRVFVSAFAIGRTVKTEPLALFDRSSRTPVIAASSSHYLAASRDSGYKTDVALVTRSSNHIQPVTLGPGAFLPAVAWNGESFLVAWFAGNRLKVGRLTQDGSVVVTEDLASPVVGRDVVLVPGGGKTLVAWQEGELYAGECPFLCPPNPHPANIYWVVLDDSGNASEPPRKLLPTPGAFSPRNPAAAWNGSHFLLTFVESFGDPLSLDVEHALSALRIAPSGSPVESLPVALLARSADWVEFPAVVAAPGGFVVAYERYAEGMLKVGVLELGNDGTVRERLVRSGSSPSLFMHGAQPVLLFSELDPSAGSVKRLMQEPLPPARRRTLR